MATRRRAPAAERNLNAEVRAIEAGHHARLQPGGWVKVTSDTHGDIGKAYRVEFEASAIYGLVTFTCKPEGPKAYQDDHLATSAQPGVAPCMHCALAARRLHREGLIAVDADDGLWHVIVDGELIRHRHVYVSGRCSCGDPADPFEGLP